MTAEVILGDCLDVLPTLPAHSFDAVITDPPYPRIKRPYGYWTEDEWLDMMLRCLDEFRRVLKPQGSALVIIQPNQEKMGRMALWPWRFVVEAAARGHRLVQDAYWLNISAIPAAGSTQFGLMRPATKWLLWFGPSDCYRDQDSVLWAESWGNRLQRMFVRARGTEIMDRHPSGHSRAKGRISEAAVRRGGVTPFNVLPIAGDHIGGLHGHGASTPMELVRWWIRYICPPGGTVLDPFGSSGTTAIAALREGRNAVLIERVPEYVEIAKRRIAEEEAKLAAQPGGLFASVV